MTRSYLNITKRLLKMIKPLLFNMILAISLGTLGHLFATGIIIFGAMMVMNYLGYTTMFTTHSLFIWIIIFGLTRGFLKYGEQSNNHFIAFKLLAIIRNHVFVALRRLAPAKLDSKNKGNLISIITSDIELLEVFYAHTISPVCIALLYTIVLVVFMIHYHILLGLVALIAYITVGVIVPVYISKHSQDIHVREKAGNLSTCVLENLRGLDEILQYQSEDYRLNKMVEQSQELIDEDRKLKKVTADNLSTSDYLVYLFDILLLVVNIYLYNHHSITFDTVVITQLAFMSSFSPVLALSALGSTLRNTFESANRVLDIIDEKPLIEEVINKEELDFNEFTISNVCFKYDQEEILSHIDLSIHKDDIIGIIGKSGSGKSTLLKLLMRFYDPSSGNIYINNKDIKEVNTKNLRDIESFVEQDTYLFNDTIENNIKIGKLDASQEEIEEACKKAGIHDFIMKLPKGYLTNTGELGDSLSGGEKQRIGLARAFLHDSPVILLDEPTSNLDSLNEAIVLRSLDQAKEDKTIILVSHRSSTLKITNKQIYIDNGRVS